MKLFPDLPSAGGHTVSVLTVAALTGTERSSRRDRTRLWCRREIMISIYESYVVNPQGVAGCADECTAM